MPAAKEETEDEETTVELPQGPIDSRVQQMITAWIEKSYKAYEALAQRKHMQINRREQNTAYLASLIAHHLGPTSTSVVPPTPPPLFVFQPWTSTPLVLSDDTESDAELPDT